MMKKIWTMVLICCLLAVTVIGCSNQEAVPAAPEATPEITPTPVPEVVIPEVEVPIIRLDSIDYQKKDDSDPGTYLINVTHIMFNPDPEGELDTDYILEEGETAQMKMSKDAVVDFPMLDNEALTVTVTLEELTSEFQAYVAATEDKPLFTVEQSGDEVVRLSHFYLP